MCSLTCILRLCQVSQQKSYSTSSKIRFTILKVCAGPLFKRSFRKNKGITAQILQIYFELEQFFVFSSQFLCNTGVLNALLLEKTVFCLPHLSQDNFFVIRCKGVILSRVRRKQIILTNSYSHFVVLVLGRKKTAEFWLISREKSYFSMAKFCPGLQDT